MLKRKGNCVQALSQLLDAATRASLESLLQYADVRKQEKFENAVEVPNGIHAALAVQ